ncbi:MAG: M16 family metallopeptidase [Terriglobia bacterium]
MAVLLILCLCGATSRLRAREMPPLVAPQQAPHVSPPAVHTFPNGLEMAVIERHDLPVVTLTLAIRSGSEADPPGLPGTAQLAAAMLDQGASHRSAMQIAALVDGAGGTLDTGAEWDDSYARLTVLSGETPLAFDLLSGITIHPQFAARELARVRKQTLSALDVLRHEPGYLADTAIERIVFSGTPYAHPAEGVEQSIGRITAGDLRAFHSRYYQPANAVLVVSGDVGTAQALELAQRYFGGWQGTGPPIRAAVKSPPAHPSRRIVVIDDPDAVQTEIRVASLAIARDSPDYDALTVANQVLGGPAENILFTALRSRRGLVYGASSSIVCYRNAGVWELQTATGSDTTIEALRVILDEMKRLRHSALGDEDVQMAQKYLIGHMALQFDTPDRTAERILDLMVYNLPLNTWSLYPQKVRQLTRDQVLEATRHYLDPRQAVIVLVGNAAAFKQHLKEFGPVRIIPLARVDLSAAGLESPSQAAAVGTSGGG